MRPAQRQVEFRRLGNQLPVLGKANSLCEDVNISLKFDRVMDLFVKLLVFCLPGYCSSGKIRVASRLCTTVPVAPPCG